MCVLGSESVESLKKHHIPFEEIEIEKDLGKGSYGKVCLGRWNHAPVALKFCKEKQGLEEFLREANLTMYVHNVCQLN
jgi:predicted Ser/Thr protein kinase